MVSTKTGWARIKTAWSLRKLMRAHRKTYVVLVRERSRMLHLERHIEHTANRISVLEKHISRLEKEMSAASDLRRRVSSTTTSRSKSRRR